MLRRITRRGWLALLLTVAVLSAGSALPVLAGDRGHSPGHEDGHSGHTIRQTRGSARALQRVRGVTFKYRDVNRALADGYTPIPIKGALCVQHEHDGAMGIHYLNPALVDGTLDPNKPELLLYFPTRTGLRLVAVEYFTPDTGQAHPTLFGLPLNGPNSTLLPEIPVHYSLHAWIWYPNPAGVFAPYNPSFHCPG